VIFAFGLAAVVAAVPGGMTVPIAAPNTLAPTNIVVKKQDDIRTAEVLALDKRTGVTQRFSVAAGATVTFGTLLIRLRTCETTPAWEPKQTAAFLQINDVPRGSVARRIYSGWMFAESPSLNPLQNARYDVWVKSCTMSFPETGPDTVVSGRKPADGASMAKKSADAVIAPAN
jgi:hypothetical protein